MNIVIAIDSFKGTLSSSALAKMVSKRLEKPRNAIKIIPISDGGEGFLESVATFYNVTSESFITFGPLMDQIESEYILIDKTAFLEIHNTSGITKIAKERLNPLKTTTYGFGLLIKHVINKGAKKIVIGLGGSATNDGGAGMLQALGMRFFYRKKEIIEPINGGLIGLVDKIDTKTFFQNIKGIDFLAASDVNNPLLGKMGAVKVFSKQKGASKEQSVILEDNLKNFSLACEQKVKKSYQNLPGAGAAGGVGFALMAFFGAAIDSGIEFIINLLDIESFIKDADMVIVGEGRLDEQTKYGKAPYGIAKIAKKHQKKVIGLFGSKSDFNDYDFLDFIYCIVPKYANESQSLANPAYYFKMMLDDINFEKL